MVAAACAAAFATALSPHGYRHGSRLAGALLLGAAVSLLLQFALAKLLARLFRLDSHGATYAAATAALILLVPAAGARTLLAGTASGTPNGDQSTQRAFEHWQLRAVPLLVRYKDALAADASSGNGRVSIVGVERARRQLVALEPAVRGLARGAPSNLRRFMPLLIRAVTLAASAQRRYEAARAARGRRARVLLREADRLLRQSQQAMTAFSFGVNGVGARLTGG